MDFQGRIWPLLVNNSLKRSLITHYRPCRPEPALILRVFAFGRLLVTLQEDHISLKMAAVLFTREFSRWQYLTLGRKDYLLKLKNRKKKLLGTLDKLRDGI